MRHSHVTSGGRYPALRTIAVLYLVGALGVLVIGVWQTVKVFMYGGDMLSNDLFGASTGMAGKVMAGVCWLAASFIGILVLAGAAELVKLFIDLEHNTRLLIHQGAAEGTAAANGSTQEGPAIPFLPDRKFIAGEETAEGALLRGH